MQLEITEDDDWTAIRISDNGIGIAPEFQDRIFDMFQQVDSSQGTGIGLAIAKQVARAHGGGAEVEESSSEGTTFRVWLARRQQ